MQTMDEQPKTDQASILASSAGLPDHVVYRTFVYETVVLNLQSGKYHGLNRVGGRMLEVIEKSETVGDAAEKLATEFGQPIERIEADLSEFCSDLAERGLITLNR
jgi:coenzyme PQQ synthesis protein D (PqqD)